MESIVGKPWDLGSIPRSPPFLNIFCFNLIPCSVRPEIHHAPTIKACQMSWKMNLKVRMGGPGNTPVNACAHAPESQYGPAFHGPKYFLYTSIIGQKTPLVCISFSFFLFFYLFVLFILVKSSKLIFIKIPKKIRNYKNKNMF